MGVRGYSSCPPLPQDAAIHVASLESICSSEQLGMYFSAEPGLMSHPLPLAFAVPGLHLLAKSHHVSFVSDFSFSEAYIFLWTSKPLCKLITATRLSYETHSLTLYLVQILRNSTAKLQLILFDQLKTCCRLYTSFDVKNYYYLSLMHRIWTVTSSA